MVMGSNTVKRLVALVLIFVTAAALSVSAAPGDISVVVGGQAVEFDVPPAIIGDRVFVPFRKIGEALGAFVEWDEENQAVAMALGERFVVLIIGEPYMGYGNVQDEGDPFIMELDAPPVVQDGRALVPLRALSEGLGADVSYDGDAGIVTISMPSWAESMQAAVDPEEFAAEVLRLTNEMRAEYELPPLSGENAALNDAAWVRAREQIESFSHTRPDGRPYYTSFDEAGVSYTAWAENIAYGQTSPAMVMEEWMNSPPHRANILSANVTDIGVGVAIGNDGVLYWVQVFCR